MKELSLWSHGVSDMTLPGKIPLAKELIRFMHS